MSDRQVLSEWRALTEAALESLVACDVEALLGILDRREQLLPQLRSVAADSPIDAEALASAEAKLLAETQSQKAVAETELTEIRTAREKLRTRDRGTLAPAITSQRA